MDVETMSCAYWDKYLKISFYLSGTKKLIQYINIKEKESCWNKLLSKTQIDSKLKDAIC